jgi:protein SCO1/2
VSLETGQPLVNDGSSGNGRLRGWLIGLGGLLAGLVMGFVILWVIGIRPFGTPAFNGITVQSPERAANFTLTTAGGEKVSLKQFRGKVVLLYFGYTYCPDVCPATMTELKRAINALGRDDDKVQVLMISVDPLRDTPEKVDEYVKHFHPSFIGLGGTEDEILAATTPLGIFYEKHEGTPDSGYLVDHTATVTVIDKDGYLRLVYPFDTPGEDIAADLEMLIKE